MSDQQPFDLDVVFEVDDYLFVYGDELTDERSEAEVAELVRLFELDAPLKILDLACGFGRHANQLTARGHIVTGVDYIPGFLTIARQQAQTMGVQVDYQQADMRHLSFDAEFDRVVLMFTSFGYFADDENLQVIKNAARALKPGGLLGFDIPHRDAIAGQPPADYVIDKDGDLIINRLSFDSLTGRFINRRLLVRDGVRKDKPFSIRLYNAQEIRDLLAHAGLEIERLSGEGGQPLSNQSQRLIVLAKKPFS